MTRRSGGTAANDRGPEIVAQAVQGAYLAQMELNHEGGHGRTPQVKLLLANSGQGGEQWEPVVDRLIAMKDDDEHRLVAVAGFGQSTTATERAVRRLRAAQVPMMGSTVAADQLSTDRPTFFRVSAPNADQTAAAAQYLRKRQAERRGYRIDVVEDLKRDDTYNESLGRDFRRAADRARLRRATGHGRTFESGGPSTATALAGLVDKICRPGERPDAVYFAGRGRELRLFVEALTAPGRDCPLTVLSGSSALGVFFDPQPKGSAAEGGDFLKQWEQSTGVKVLYTAYAHPDGASAIYPDKDANPYPAFARAYERAGFGGTAQLRSGQSMMGHDAVLTLGRAIRDAAGFKGASAVDAGGVRNMLLQIGEDNVLPGLSGPIAFDERGNPEHKPMALVELRPDPTHRYVYRDTVVP